MVCLEMAKNPFAEKWVQADSNSLKQEEEKEEGEDSEEEEEEEALSLCDLPLCLIKEENQPRKQVDHALDQSQEDFNFGSWLGPHLPESDMCAADEVFFRGQILPLRLSVGSEGAFTGVRTGSNPSRSISRSESMGHASSGGLTAVSSRSSSTRSHNSSSSSSTTSAGAATTTCKLPRVRNPFHSHPSPKPQIRIPNTRAQNSGGRCRRSTVWDIFRLGLVQTPEIQLKDLKLRDSTNNSRKSFGSSSNSSRNSDLGTTDNGGHNNTNPIRKSLLIFNTNSRSGNGFWGGGCTCKSSVGAVEIPAKIVDVKNGGRSSGRTEMPAAGKEEEEEEEEQREKKQSMSRHRTFEWLKELSSHAGEPTRRASLDSIE
ncbi:uncharacterized protein LOC131159236 [Malania oleifera]|uniref:uncharacterized protein LOC131159236 n=1 Tax=Malania oleifera TaxID=397392 RepID=UPI0025ADFB76|nr:uncharacterized protein LOC131159236 [Malania oleifera]